MGERAGRDRWKGRGDRGVLEMALGWTCFLEERRDLTERVSVPEPRGRLGGCALRRRRAPASRPPGLPPSPTSLLHPSPSPVTPPRCSVLLRGCLLVLDLLSEFDPDWNGGKTAISGSVMGSAPGSESLERIHTMEGHRCVREASSKRFRRRNDRSHS